MSEPKPNQNESETTESEHKSDDSNWETTESKRETGISNRINRRNLLKGVTAAAFLGTTGASARESSLQAELASLGTYSKERRAEQQEFPFQYAVKFVCGNAQGRAVAVGRYQTAINLHNPNEEPVEFQWKVAPAFTEEPGPFSDFIRRELESDQALEIDCPQIFQLGEDLRRQDLFKGFVVIESTAELDVVAVYSAGRDTVETLDVERVSPRDLREDDGLPDLVPVPDPEISPQFCRRNEAGDLLVVVENQGTAAAGASTTRVNFGNDDVLERDTPPLDVGESTRLMFPIPANCYAPDCTFTIMVDANDDVSESNDRNNVADGFCLG